MNKILLQFLVFAMSMLSFTCLTDAKDTDYFIVSLESAYQVEVPKSWKIHKEETNKSLQSKTDSILNSKNIKQNSGQNRILLTANAYVGGKSVASTRLSVRPSKSAFTQDVLKEITKNDLQEVAASMMFENEKELKALSKDATVKFIKIDKPVINGKICISTETEQNVNGNILRQIIDIYPLGDRTVKMTVAYSPSNANMYRPIVNKIRNSLIIK